MTILIAGAGIAGLTMGLTLHQLGLPFRIFETVRALAPLGVGINLQPNAVRELIDLGLGPDLDRIAVRTRQYGFYTTSGREIWVEPRGTWAGYAWPQYSVHRGRLQMLLADTLRARAGEGVLVTGQRATGWQDTTQGVTLRLAEAEAAGSLLIAADGIHSAIRAQMHPAEGAPVWSGAILWRAVSRGRPFFGGAAMALAGNGSQRFVSYPIGAADPDTGLCDLNWIAEQRVDPALGFAREDWSRQVDRAPVLDLFRDWRFDWLDIPAVIRAAPAVYEYPMVDRDPVDRWTEGRVTLIGDAAHPTYPVGSNGASQAIVDARTLGARLRDHGPGPAALAAYEAEVRPRMERVIRANRGKGPDAVMQMVEDRCGGVFDRIEDVIPHAELAAHAAQYKALAGFGIDDLNRQPPLIGPIR